MSNPLVIDYYSDILCVWAWITQRRIDELNLKLQSSIVINYHYIDVFGDVATKINNQWQAKGGYSGFASHVQHSAAAFKDAPVNEKIWAEIRPTTSANVHLVLKAIEVAFGAESSINAALQFRKAFYIDALDISDMNVLMTLAEQHMLDIHSISQQIKNGSAMALLMKDYQNSKLLNLKGSPSFILDGGRQTLYGNVGYRVLLANIEELQNKSPHEASWC